jgi:hypothetical protein
MAELHFYDFDGTLFRSPMEPAVWDRDWWSNVDSLIPPCVPDRPGSDWWVGSTVSEAKRSIGNQDVYAVMATGRPAASGLRYRVPELLKQKGLSFDEVHLAPPSGTLAWKKGLIKEILGRYPFIDAVSFWDDRRSHLPEFERVAIRAGIDPERIKLTHVRSKSKTPECDSLDDAKLLDHGKKPSYLGLFLDAKSKADLIHAFPYLHDRPQASHVTLIRKPSAEDMALIGTKGSAIVIGYAEDDKAQAVLVKLSPNLPLASGKIPHVTLSVAQGVKAQYSNELLRGDVEPTKGVRLQGVVDVFPRRLSPARLATLWVSKQEVR